MVGDAFEANWLDLREPVDSESRARPLERLLTQHLRGRERLEITDLGAGTGSNLRHLAPRLTDSRGVQQHWTLLDADTALLSDVPARTRSWAQARGYTVVDQNEGLEITGRAEAPFTLDIAPRQANLQADPLPVARADLVTASALLDLVSRDWLQAFAQRLWEIGAAALIALSYDGHIAWQPQVAGDEEVMRLVNQHQRGEKTFGTALGPDGGAVAAAELEAAGFELETAQTPWRLGPSDQALQQHLHAGWAAAASETAPHRAEAIRAWLERRIDLLESGQGQVTVGHLDVLALPPG
ncbi:class I SAM-dependent methyltransferase [Rhodovibrio salinarum]|uniref:Class I SAM-dependent methyltransferase n=1 Tax=Rhodovibrio salinarum TaxID=1087 RepID=A0A934QIE8_9PROT|nr:class I SAM-dependent methyltransferase [Rhodovibrio salinarum]MBK1697566.1 class I SAM-dependent methyltransferase [Rhodovibrio salinarum]